MPLLPLPLQKEEREKEKARIPKKRRFVTITISLAVVLETLMNVGFFMRLPAAEVAKMKPPVSQAGSRASSPAGEGATPKAKAGAKAKAAGGRNPSYCFKFAQPGGCNDKNCPYMHMDEAMIKEFERAGNALKKNANAKP